MYLKNPARGRRAALTSPGNLNPRWLTPLLCLAALALAVAVSIPRRALAQTPPPLLSLQLSNGHVQLSITGAVDSLCTLQRVTNLTDNWQFLTNFVLSNSSFRTVDATGPSPDQRFYLAFTQQVPTNVLATNMVFISPGTFTLGSPDTEPGRDLDEGPQTSVTFTQAFWMAKYLVTQAEYASLMGSNPSSFLSTGLSGPVETVNWDDATAYCTALTQRERQAGRIPSDYTYRLPTEAEWEYSCRAGSTTAFHYGPALRSGMANFVGTCEYPPCGGSSRCCTNLAGTSLGRTTPVGSYAPNGWGLYDMHGNLYQWVQDWYSATNYPGGTVTNLQGPISGVNHVIRSGAWNAGGSACRSASRTPFPNSIRNNAIGFRVLLAAPPGG